MHRGRGKQISHPLCIAAEFIFSPGGYFLQSRYHFTGSFGAFFPYLVPARLVFPPFSCLDDSVHTPLHLKTPCEVVTSAFKPVIFCSKGGRSNAKA
jgi:hypothetical protein